MPHPRAPRSAPRVVAFERPLTSSIAGLSIACLSIVCWSTAAFATSEPVVNVTQSGAKIVWTPLVEHEGHTLTISGPAGYRAQSTHLPWKDAVLETHDLRDGTYTWRNVLMPVVSSEVEEMIHVARIEGFEIEDLLLADGLLVRQIATGSFRILDGEPIVPDTDGPGDPETLSEALRPGDTRTGTETEHLGPVPFKNRISPSLCVGEECPPSSVFDRDTLRLQEDQLRVHFDDDSTASAYPRREWLLIANDLQIGGLDRFSIANRHEDRLPFTIEGGAPESSLYLAESGSPLIGLGTNSPDRPLHLVTGDSPTVRFEQEVAGAMGPQTWDVIGSEQAFRIRDVTGGSSDPFRILPGAWPSSLVIERDGDVGISAAGPVASLHVRRADGRLLVEDTSLTASSGSARTLLQLENLGKLDFRLADTSSGNIWKFENDPNGFFISLDGSGATEMALRNNGDLIIAGTLTESSDVARKERIEGVDPQEILASVLELPIATWSYIDDPTSARHIGPMAQDFYAAFGYGGTSTGIQPRNLVSVALAAVQGFDTKASSTEASLRADLAVEEQSLDELERRLAALEAMLLEGPVE